ncbi:hypothetical protein ATK36_0516 [Amycolatopsis sulphurea]|uniref:Secreted protein n=1 Tax=Amycolatopsis sulphurea TaxID=76022 RepID=A0A2A9G2L0_9PSEU|nr:hypothetical protein ATK36_0516 [Amycolatopsis sulphurea]
MLRFIRIFATTTIALVASASIATAAPLPDPPAKPNCGSDIESVFVKGGRSSTSFRVVGTNLWRWLGQDGGGIVHTYVNAPGMSQKHFQSGASGRGGARSGLISVTTARQNISLYVMLNNDHNDTLCTKSMGV